jgi:hypothetical protein
MMVWKIRLEGIVYLLEWERGEVKTDGPRLLEFIETERDTYYKEGSAFLGNMWAEKDEIFQIGYAFRDFINRVFTDDTNELAWGVEILSMTGEPPPYPPAAIPKGAVA